MYKSWNPMLENLPYEKLGELMYYILLYQDGDVDVEPTDPMVAAMFAMIKNTMDQDTEKYAETCAKRAESGKKGGRPKKQEEEQETNATDDKAKKANGFSEKQVEAKKADTDNEYDNDTDNDTDIDNENDISSSTKKKSKPKKKADPVDYEGMLNRSELPTSVIEKVLEWVEYKKSRREPYVEIGFKSFITQTEGHVRQYGSENVVNVIDKTMSSNYKGVVWDWLKNSRPTTGKVDWDSL